MPVLRVLVLSEDGSEHAHAVVVALSKAMLKIVDASVQTQREKLQFAEERDEGRRAMSANRWRSNLELMAPGYPAEAVCEAGKSFYETFDRMTRSPDLLAALARTYAMPAPRDEPPQKG
ncbi:MAG TPA: hypothetical protein VE093_10815 [Polyangiaceae bacterium]|jgi:hypothetical protein|nr:hypothetical protein [Polyangiaceae bacterium]